MSNKQWSFKGPEKKKKNEQTRKQTPVHTDVSKTKANNYFSIPTPRPSLISIVIALDTTSREAKSLALGA
jgi:hypothetical protein